MNLDADTTVRYGDHPCEGYARVRAASDPRGQRPAVVLVSALRPCQPFPWPHAEALAARMLPLLGYDPDTVLWVEERSQGRLWCKSFQVRPDGTPAAHPGSLMSHANFARLTAFRLPLCGLPKA